MPIKSSAMKTTELVVLLKPFVFGFILAEILLAATMSTSLYISHLGDLAPWGRFTVVALTFGLCVYYFYLRDGHKTAIKITSSKRIDLFATFILGILVQIKIYQITEKYHLDAFALIANWVPLIYTMLIVVLLSPIMLRAKKHTTVQSSFFISDKEIKSEAEDLLDIKEQAVRFAHSVMQSADVFGVDGPWGSGKTSFINIAESVWKKNNNFLVCRFEPLRFASEPDIANRLIRDLASIIQKQAYAPEFWLAANRFSRLIKGKAEVSFFGFKFTLEPSHETVEDLLDDIDAVLKQLDLRIIIVIDDLDRLDAKNVNNILFATKRTLQLTQATYVLCYDTEILAGSQDESSRAREFLEKFITIKFSLFNDKTAICNFLRTRWKDSILPDGTTPPDAIIQLSKIFDELANLLDGEKAADYLPLVGNMRKVKRLINAVRLMQIEKTNFARTDFNKQDLINLILLHLHYPGIFRQIYSEETHGHSGRFSVKYDHTKRKDINSELINKTIQEEKFDSPTFILKQLFDINTIVWSNYTDGPSEDDYASRACFNRGNIRNLESYLNLIVRVETPEPQSTLILYKDAFEEVKNGTNISSVLEREEFTSDDWEYAHERLWTMIVNKAHLLPERVVEHTIYTLVDYFPKSPLVSSDYRSLREILIYSLITLLDSARLDSGIPRTSGSEVKIAWIIFGEHQFKDRGLLRQLVNSQRGPIGWFDLLLFRVSCSADRNRQNHRLLTSLIKNQDERAETTGNMHALTIYSMRKLSQRIFIMFKDTYIKNNKNIIAEIDSIDDAIFLGKLVQQRNIQVDSVDEIIKIKIIRLKLKSFIIYQLSNNFPPSGEGIGCGYYDESGAADSQGIAKEMNNYVFDICFNPSVDRNNAFYFFDHCLSHLNTPFDTGDSAVGLTASKDSIAKGLSPEALGRFWLKYNAVIRPIIKSSPDRVVHTSNYSVKYNDVIDQVFSTLDLLADEKALPTPPDSPALQL